MEKEKEFLKKKSKEKEDGTHINTRVSVRHVFSFFFA